jgi:integrase
MQMAPSLAAALAALEAEILASYEDCHLGQNHAEKYVRDDRCYWQRFAASAGAAFCYWERRDMDRFSRAMRTARTSLHTMRRRQGAIRRILDHARDPAYDFDERCYALTGRRIPQICTLANTVLHQKGAPTSKRRDLTEHELEGLFEAIRARFHKAERRGMRSALPAGMHYAILGFSLAFGTREREVAFGDLADLHPALSPEIRAFSPFEDFVVRFGKGNNGSGPKRRTVSAIYIFREYLASIAWYLREIRPHLVRPGSPPAIFLGARGERLRPDTLSAIFRGYADRAGLCPDLTHHCLRHTFETKLRESGLDVATIQGLLGHEQESTTLIYDHLGDEFFRERALEHNRRLLRACEDAHDG